MSSSVQKLSIMKITFCAIFVLGTILEVVVLDRMKNI